MSRAELDRQGIRRFWESVGADDERVNATTPDSNLGALESAFISRWVDGAKALLEVGCGDGRYSVKYARLASSYLGVDASSSLVDRAKSSLADIPHARVRQLALPSVPEGRFDTVVSQRCLINLADWPTQATSIQRLATLIPVGGRFVLTEGFVEGFRSLNRLRESVSLESIRTVAWNRFLKREEFEESVDPWFEIEHRQSYGGYFLLTRVFYPLMVSPDEPTVGSRWNDAARQLVENGFDAPEYSYNVGYVLRRR